MSNKGRDFELLVEKLEKILSGSEVEVIHDASLTDIRTGDKRQIDVLVRGRLGSHELLVILECRNRNTKDDVTWIEQLANKRAAVRADKAVAISAAGFTANAIKVAEHEGIVLRTIDELSLADIASWFEAKEVIVSQPHFDVVNVSIEVCGSELEPSTKELEIIKDKIQQIYNQPQKKYLGDSGNAISLAELWDYTMSLPDEIRNRLENSHGVRELIRYTVNFNPPISIVNFALCKVCSVTFSFFVSIEIMQFSPYKIVKYTENKTTLGEIVHFRIEVDGSEQDIDIFRSDKKIDVVSSIPYQWEIEFKK